MLKKFLMPVRLKRVYRDFKERPIKWLDVGCGNHSPSVTKKFFPQCEYHGLDQCRYNIDQEDEKSIDTFYAINLDEDTLDTIPDEAFDVILVAHVLEHLKDPARVLGALCRKLKKGGAIYVEFPSLRSLGLSSHEGTLQFCDDGTHIHLPNPYEMANTLLQGDVRIVQAKTRRDPARILLSPLFYLRNLGLQLQGKRPRSKGLWDISGFAFYLYGVKKSDHVSAS